MENEITFQQKSSNYKRLDFLAAANGNTVDLTIPKDPEDIRTIEVLLSQKMFDFSKEVVIRVNGIVKKRYWPCS